MTALVTKHAPLVAGAPDGIRKLRALIQQLGVQGRLIPKSAGWESLTLADLGKWAVGSGFPTAEQGKKDLPILFCKVSDMNLAGNEQFIRNTNHTIDEDAAKRLRVNIHPAGTVVFPKIGGAIATNKRRILIKPSAIDNNCLGISPRDTVSSDYLYLLLSSIDFTVYQAGTSVPALSQGVIGQISVGLPSLTEQHRIVAKVDELMALCDRLEADQADAEAAHAQIVQALLDSLTKATDAADFRASWQRLSEHFHTIFTTEASIDALKQTVLQLAVMGLLSQQVDSDPSASTLLGQIATARTSAAASSNRRNIQKPIAPVLAQETPYALPNGWVWTRAEAVSEVIVDCPHSTPKFVPDGVLCLDTNSVKQGALVLARARYVDQATYYDRISRLVPQPGDIVFAREGSVGESMVIPDGMVCCLGQRMMLFRPCLVFPDYFRLALSEPGALARSLALHKGIGAKHVNVADMRNALIPLPPLPEQHRIVAKVNELMALCDQLKAGLAASRQLHGQVATALVEQALV